VQTIGERAFQGCASLTGVIIPTSVTNIGASAFYGCTDLTTIYARRADAPALSVFGENWHGGAPVQWGYTD
jgi:hypothetical protein